MEFYSPREKIKLLRKKLGVNQSQLESENMTRAYISMLESGKRKVSYSCSKILANRFNELGKNMSIEFNLDDEYFSREPKDDARIYCINQLKLIEELNHESFNELIEIQLKFQLDDLLAETYKIKGEIYLKEKDYTKALIYLNNALGKYKETKNDYQQGSIYKKLGGCKILKGDNEEALFLLKQALIYSSKVSDAKTFIKSSHDIALVYANLKNFDACINILDQNILNNPIAKDENIINSAKLIKANALFETQNQKEAVKEYFSLLEDLKTKDSVTSGILYTNIAEYYYNIGDYYNSLKYIDEAQRIKAKVSKRSLIPTLALKSKVLFSKGYYEESLMIFELAIEISIEYKLFSLLISNFKDLAKMFEDKRDYANSTKIYKLMLHINGYAM